MDVIEKKSMTLEQILKKLVDLKVSDAFIIPGLPLSYNLNGKQKRTNGERMSPEETKQFLKELYHLADRDFDAFVKRQDQDDDFSFSKDGIGRFRANVFRQRGSYAAVIRVIPFGIPNPKEYNIPEQVLSVANYSKGLVLITGPASAGKSTTLATIIDRLNKTRVGHIITMEDPIEYVHRHEKCIVTQREIPSDVATYDMALKSAMREAPNVILLGEMRDQETIATAMTAAEMAQLLFSTLHTNSAADTVDRIIDAFPPSQQRQIRMQLSMVLQAVVSQQLVPTVDGKVMPAFEIMRANTAIRTLIRDGKTHQLDTAIAGGYNEGMITMDQSLFEMFMNGLITRETALQYANHPESLEDKFFKHGV